MVGKKIELDAKVTLSNSVQHAIRPKVRGMGHLWLEPSYDYHVRYDLDGEIVVEHHFFWACQSPCITNKIKVISLKASAVGDSVPIHTKLVGKGWVVFRIPVPECEIQKIKLHDEKLTVDHHRSVIFRSNSIKFSAEFAGKGMFQKTFNTTNEGVLRTYTGSGEVWLLPTVLAYEHALAGYSQQQLVAAAYAASGGRR